MPGTLYTSVVAAINGRCGGDLQATAAAALGSTSRGMDALVDDVAGLYVVDDTPADEPRYRARFYFDTNGFDPGEAVGHQRTRVFIAFSQAPQRRVAAVVLRRVGGVYAVMVRTRLDTNQQVDTGFFTISDGPHAIELDLTAATSADTQDGSLEVWVDGAQVAHLTGLDNNLAAADFVRMGALSVKSGATGTLYFDEFESRRTSYIGLLP
jgi:hypothetical protein